ncbi:unnamed protein product [Gadus morhua 'NCC']
MIGLLFRNKQGRDYRREKKRMIIRKNTKDGYSHLTTAEANDGVLGRDSDARLITTTNQPVLFGPFFHTRCLLFLFVKICLSVCWSLSLSVSPSLSLFLSPSLPLPLSLSLSFSLSPSLSFSLSLSVSAVIPSLFWQLVSREACVCHRQIVHQWAPGLQVSSPRSVSKDGDVLRLHCNTRTHARAHTHLHAHAH